jgi:hypothetical protein
MAVNREFLGRLEREIESLKLRIEAKKNSSEFYNNLEQTQARLTHLEALRQKVLDESHGG